MGIATVSKSGRITIPADIRRKHRILPGDRLLLAENDAGELILKDLTPHAELPEDRQEEAAKMMDVIVESWEEIRI